MLDTFCLALVIFVEARGEPIDGQFMVADVVMNRVKQDWWPDDVCSVVFEDEQFSGIGTQIDFYEVFTDPYWNSAIDIATEALEGSLMGSDATHFHTTDVNPYWSNQLTLLGRYGNHMFYKEDKR